MVTTREVATREPLMFIRSMLPDNHGNLAYRQYKSIVTALVANRRLLEIGAGRRPLLTLEEIKERNIRYTANDVMQNELNLIPFPVERAVFDSCGGIPPECAGCYDVICSKMAVQIIPFYHQEYFASIPGFVLSMMRYPNGAAARCTGALELCIHGRHKVSRCGRLAAALRQCTLVLLSVPPPKTLK
jgi:hypothetical protein